MKASKVIEVHSLGEYNDRIASKAAETQLVVMNFWASWAQPCLQMNDVFAELASKYPNALFLQVS